MCYGTTELTLDYAKLKVHRHVKFSNYVVFIICICLLWSLECGPTVNLIFHYIYIYHVYVDKYLAYRNQ